MSILGIPLPVQPLTRVRTFDPSTAHDPMPDFAEPILSPTGIPDELAPAYCDSRRDSYAAAHAEADTDDLLCELDELWKTISARDFTAAEFLEQVRADCPGLIATFSAFSYVHLDCFPDQPPVSERYEARAKFPDGSPLRNIEAPTWKELAEKLVAEFRARKGLRAVPVIEAAAV